MQRRHFIQLAASSAALAAQTRVFAQAKKLVLSGSGGVVADVNRAIYYEPFTAATGIVIENVPTEQQRMAQLEAMVKGGRTSWDAMEISGADYPLGVARGLFMPIDYSRIDPKGELPAIARKEFGVAAATYSEVLIVRRDKLPAGKKMTGWADFWDVKNFPGPRGLSALPKINLEFALIADGAPLADLYKILGTRDGVDRAFKKLDQIKPHISRFWKSGAESVQLLTSGEAHFCSAFNGRITSVRQGGIPADIVWNGGAMYLSYIGMPKGAKNTEAAYQYIRVRTMDAEKMRRYVAKLPYPGFAPGLTDGMKPADLEMLPTNPPNVAVQFEASDAFWATNLPVLQERWNEWMLR